MTKRLIVNADDYGFTPAVSAGIRKAHLNGIVTTTTAMMNSPSAKDDLHKLAQESPTLRAGVHLVLTAGRPVHPASKVPSLVRSDGTFRSYNELRQDLAQLDPPQLHDEWRAQIERFLETGLVIDHIDSHHHVSYWSEATFEVMLSLAEEFHVPIRCPLSSASEPDSDDEYIYKLLAKHSVRRPERMIDAFYNETATYETMTHILDTLPEGISEVMSHPGFIDDALRASDSYTDPRLRELEILTSDRIKALIKSYQIELITFSQM
jgi:predicted glycoside hydrolase/deacetylase ChbG (UPF0249 family)